MTHVVLVGELEVRAAPISTASGFTERREGSFHGVRSCCWSVGLQT